MIISESTKLAGIMAWPVSHSLSPRLHRYWIDQYEIRGTYVPLAVTPEHFQEALRNLPKIGFSGVNVTLPHKEMALITVDAADKNARRIGAVNTVVVQEDGSLFGTNTDSYGFLENMRATLLDWRADAGPAVVLGAGGAARGVCAALLDEGVPKIHLVNRTQTRARSLVADLGGPFSVTSWADREDILEGTALLVNTTSLGMTGMENLEIRLDALPKSAAVCDIVYTPLETNLLADARARGNPVVDGLGMLLHQACPGFQAWFGVAPKVSRGLRSFVLESLKS